jgi:hypothetical protein
MTGQRRARRQAETAGCRLRQRQRRGHCSPLTCRNESGAGRTCTHDGDCCRECNVLTTRTNFSAVLDKQLPARLLVPDRYCRVDGAVMRCNQYLRPDAYPYPQRLVSAALRSTTELYAGEKETERRSIVTIPPILHKYRIY